MKEKSIKSIVKKIVDEEILSIERRKYEDYEGYYNVWEVVSNNNSYILKQATIEELNNYNKLNSDSLPKLYGHTKYYNKTYILIQFINGINLNEATKENVIKTLDSLISIQEKYWNHSGIIGISFEEKLSKVIKRKEYLCDEILEKAYDKFINIFTSCEITFVHDDLLPFNVIINNEKCKLIDLEYIGILPYPLSICRLITHCKDEKDYIFYMKEEDKQFAIDYYYTNFIEKHNIEKGKYLKTIKSFMFYEFTEWVFVYNKYNKSKDQRYEYYYLNSKKLAEEILEGLYD